MNINQSAFVWVHQFAGRWLVLDWSGIFFADYLAYFLVAGFFVFIFTRRGRDVDARRRFYLFAEATLAVILARGIITEVFHFFYYHPRPFDVLGFSPLVAGSGSSFPSGHAAWFFALAMSLWFADRKWGWWYFAAAALMGVARVYAGVHWPLDIVVGAIVGIGSALIIRLLLKPSRAKLV